MGNNYIITNTVMQKNIWIRDILLNPTNNNFYYLLYI